MKFIELHVQDQCPVLVNIDTIKTIFPQQKSYSFEPDFKTTLCFDSAYVMRVTESYEEIKKLMMTK